MVNVAEIIDFGISFILSIYLIVLVKNDCQCNQAFWFWGLLMLMLSKLWSVFEEIFLYQTLNHAEHLFFTVAVFFIVISVVKKELS